MSREHGLEGRETAEQVSGVHVKKEREGRGKEKRKEGREEGWKKEGRKEGVALKRLCYEK